MSAELCHVGRGGVESAYAIGGATAESACVFRSGRYKLIWVEIQVRALAAAAPATLEGGPIVLDRKQCGADDRWDIPGEMR